MAAGATAVQAAAPAALVAPDRRRAVGRRAHPAGRHVVEQLATRSLMAAVVGVLNAVLPPLIAALRLPFMLALGFILILLLNALVLLLASDLARRHLQVDNFGWALLAALVVAAVSVVLEVIFGTNDDDTYTLRVDPADRQAPGRRDAHRRAGDHLPRDRRPRAAGAAPRDARRQRARPWRAGSPTAPTGWPSGRPTSPRRPARARPGSCSARTRTSPRSAGSRRRRAR